MAVLKRKGKYGVVYDVQVYGGRAPDNNGVMRKKWYWKRGFKNKVEALKHERAKKVEIDQKGYLPTSKHTINSWLKTNLVWKEGKVGESAYISYVRYVDHIVMVIGNLSLKDFNIETAKNLRATLQRKLADQTVKHMETFIKKAMDLASELNYIPRNPYRSSRWDKISIRGPEKEIFQPQEQKDIMSAAIGYSLKRNDQRWFMLAYLALSTGMRLGELAGLKWKDIDPERKFITVSRSITWVRGETMPIEKQTKSRAGDRQIAITDNDVKVLEKYKLWCRQWFLKLGKSLVGEHYVIPFDDLGAFHKTSAQKRFAQIEKLAGVKHLGMHALRHTHVSNLVAAHQKINSISERIGHANPSITLNTYTHLFKEDANRDKIEIANANILS